MALVFIGVVGYYGWMFVRLGQIEKNIVTKQQDITNVKNEVTTIKNRGELYTRQAQLKSLDTLIEKHSYWSNIFPALAKSTFKKAAYSTMSLTNDGNVTISVVVPTLEDVDKFMQVFDQPEVMDNFSSLRVGSFHKAQDEDRVVYRFDVRFQFNPAVLQYKNIER